MDSHPQFRGAPVEVAPVWLNRNKSLEKACAQIRQASDAVTDLICFPEAWLAGYPWLIWLGTPAWEMSCSAGALE